MNKTIELNEQQVEYLKTLLENVQHEGMSETYKVVYKQIINKLENYERNN